MKFREPDFARGNRSSVVGIRSRESLRTGPEAANGHDDETHSSNGGEDSDEEDRQTPEEHGSIWLPRLPHHNVPPVPLHRQGADDEEDPTTDHTQNR